MKLVKDAFGLEVREDENLDTTKLVEVVASTNKRPGVPSSESSKPTKKQPFQPTNIPTLRELLALDQKDLANWIIKYFTRLLSMLSEYVMASSKG